MSGKGKDFRPITDVWMLAPSKVGYYGAYPNGFLQRARMLLVPVGIPILHVCSGAVKRYPGYGLGPYDKTLDLDPTVEPDFLQDAREPFPLNDGEPWWGILMDPPYSRVYAENYNVGPTVYPEPAQLLKNAWQVLAVGGRVGLLHQVHPSEPAKNARLGAAVSVIQGTKQTGRIYTVFEKEDPRSLPSWRNQHVDADES